MRTKLPVHLKRPKHGLWLLVRHLVGHKFAHVDLKYDTLNISFAFVTIVHLEIDGATAFDLRTFLSFGTNFQATRPTDVGRCSLHNLCESMQE